MDLGVWNIPLGKGEGVRGRYRCKIVSFEAILRRTNNISHGNVGTDLRLELIHPSGLGLPRCLPSFFLTETIVTSTVSSVLV